MPKDGSLKKHLKDSLDLNDELHPFSKSFKSNTDRSNSRSHSRSRRDDETDLSTVKGGSHLVPFS